MEYLPRQMEWRCEEIQPGGRVAELTTGGVCRMLGKLQDRHPRHARQTGGLWGIPAMRA